MTLGKFVSGGLFLQTIGVIGLLSARRKATPPSPAEVAASGSESQSTCERDGLRKHHKVQLIGREYEGLGFDKVPNGAYGWTYSPAGEAPLFASPTFQSFEMHKASDGTGYLIGFVTGSDSSRIDAGTEPLNLRLFPEPYDDADSLVCLPLDRVRINGRHPNRTGGNWLSVTIGAAS